jgi:hypothetical protein
MAGRLHAIREPSHVENIQAVRKSMASRATDTTLRARDFFREQSSDKSATTYISDSDHSQVGTHPPRVLYIYAPGNIVCTCYQCHHRRYIAEECTVMTRTRIPLRSGKRLRFCVYLPRCPQMQADVGAWQSPERREREILQGTHTTEQLEVCRFLV